MAEENKGQNPSEDVKLEEEMTQEELDALKNDEEFILNFKEEDKADPEKVKLLDAALKNAQTTIHQKRHYRDKYNEVTKKPGEGGKPTPPAAPVTPPAKPQDNGRKEVDAVTVLTFRQDHPELPKEVTKEIIDHAAAYGITPEEALKKPIIKKYIKDALDTVDVEDASIVPGSHAGSGIGERDWNSASKEDVEKQRMKILYPNG